MTYYQDLTEYQYNPHEIIDGSLNIGWLGPDVDFCQAQASEEFLDRLLAFCAYSYSLSRGLHYCELCDEYGMEQYDVEFDGRMMTLGTAEIRVLGGDGTIFCAPNLIYHYVKDHHYEPPAAFHEAVLNGPLPNSPEHKELFDKRGWASGPTPHLVPLRGSN
ncbi:DUF7919 family protein [Halovulum sp. GXIMD14793]